MNFKKLLKRAAHANLKEIKTTTNLKFYEN